MAMIAGMFPHTQGYSMGCLLRSRFLASWSAHLLRGYETGSGMEGGGEEPRKRRIKVHERAKEYQLLVAPRETR